MKKKLLALTLAALMALSLAACGGDTADSADTETESTETESTDASGETYTVGIIQQMQHEALDAATEGFQDALTELLGDRVKFDLQNASGEASNCSTIVGSFVSSDVDLIMANGTAALQAAQAATADIPILGTSITEYGVSPSTAWPWALRASPAPPV